MNCNSDADDLANGPCLARGDLNHQSEALFTARLGHETD